MLASLRVGFYWQVAGQDTAFLGTLTGMPEVL